MPRVVNVPVRDFFAAIEQMELSRNPPLAEFFEAGYLKIKYMKKLLVLLFSIVFIAACGDSANINAGGDSIELKDPATVQPPSENIPDTMTIKKDSVVVPETNSDSAR